MLSIFTFLAALAATTLAQADDSALVAQLLTANSQLARIKDITNDTAFVFDFLSGARGNASGGFAIAANSQTFPALLTGRGAMTVGVLGPCGANSPHTHPRATEIQIVVQGGPIMAEFIQENGARAVQNVVPIGSATLFPEGSIHFQQNLACEPTVFIASFDNVDPGTSQIAQNFFALDAGVVNATLGDLGATILENLKLPENLILGAQSCLDRCGIDRSTFNFSATFKDFAIFSNSTWATPPALPASVTDQYSGKSSAAGKSTLSNLLADGSVDVPFNKNPLRSAVMGLAAAVVALLLTVVALLITMACRRRSGVKMARFTGGGAVGGPSYTYATPYDDSDSSRRSTDKL
jgi:hypothetical protein